VGLTVGVCALGAAFSLSAAEPDVTKLPPAATVKVEFVRDIQPIFEGTCYRCHGPERPKGKFRLDDRDAALKGGDNGVDIIPGNSAKSPLIHYVARLVPDMEMPPAGKGEPVSAEKVALLRAWIDQGAEMPVNAAASQPQFSVSPTIRWITVDGNEQKFREHHWMREGWSGGAAEFSWRQPLRDGQSLAVEGHALPNQNDYQLGLKYDRPEVGFVRAGFEQYRKYYDDRGGYYAPFAPSSFDLDRDLQLTRGKAWVDVGLTLPDWPRMVLGYEYQYKHGTEATLQWGESTQGAEVRKIFPATKGIDEQTHILKFDLDHELYGVRIEDNFRAEFYDLKTDQRNVSVYNPAGVTPTLFTRAQEGERHFLGVNTLRLEKAFTDWLYASGGYLYSRVESDAAFSTTTMDGTGAPAAGDYWNSRQIVLDQQTHLFNLNGLLGPWEGLTFSAGLQNELVRQHGLGDVSLDYFDPSAPPAVTQPARLSSDLDKTTFQENFILRYAGLPYTALYAEARFQQESIGQLEQEAGSPVDFGRDFLRDTDARNDLKEYRAGFNVSPWTRVSFNANYKHQERHSDFNHQVDQTPPLPPFSGLGYSAFIRERSTITDEASFRLVLRPTSWLKTTLSYKLVATDFSTSTDALPFATTPGGPIDAGDYDAHVYSANFVLTPWRRLYLSTTLSYTRSCTAAADNVNASVVPYRGDVYSALASGTYALNDRTDLQTSYSFSRGDYGQANQATGLPLGMDYQQHEAQMGLTRRFKKGITGRLQYAFYYYDEPSSGNLNNYTAHGIFATLTFKWP
jgi:mono/diheme cytochrome c family protein